MILDNFLNFSGSWSNGVWTGQTVTGTGNVLSTNVLDLASMSPNQAPDIGMGEPLEIAFAVTTAFAGATSVEMQLVTADDAAITTNVQVIVSTGAVAIANLSAGKTFALHVDRSAPNPALRRYMAVRYVIVGTGSAGAMLANMVKSYQDPQISYKSGFAVL